jgi:hypothetical protein
VVAVGLALFIYFFFTGNRSLATTSIFVWHALTRGLHADDPNAPAVADAERKGVVKMATATLVEEPSVSKSAAERSSSSSATESAASTAGISSIEMAVSSIILSKTFDNGVICASEQSVVVHDKVYDKVRAEFQRRGAYFLNEEEKVREDGRDGNIGRRLLFAQYSSANHEEICKPRKESLKYIYRLFNSLFVLCTLWCNGYIWILIDKI